MLRIAFIISFLCVCLSSNATINDSLNVEDKNYAHFPKRSAIWSAVIPGAGQIYNEIGYRRVSQKKHRAWWKVPLIYGGLGACGYYFYHNNQFANLTKQEWLFRQDYPDSYLDERFMNYSTDELITGNTNAGILGNETFSRRRDIFIFAFVGIWGLNVVEAFVDGHFVSFDVSEDLSLSAHPTMLGYNAPGMTFKLNFN